MSMRYDWGKPADSVKWHLFAATGCRSLCGKWLMDLTNADEQEDSARPLSRGTTDCKACVREYNRRLKVKGR